MTRTATFEIVNATHRRALPCAQLTFDSEKGWEIVLSPQTSVNDVPAFFIPFIEKGELVIGDEWARSWVDERIVPSGRQNLNEILDKHGLREYDELTLLRSSKGISSLDDFMVREIDSDTNIAEQKAMIQKKIGQTIRRKRTERGMTQSDLARQLGIYQSALSNIEQGKTNPTIDMLFDISDALDCSIADIVSAPDEPLWNVHRERLFQLLQRVSFGQKPHRQNNDNDPKAKPVEDNGEIAYAYKRLIDELETYSESNDSAAVDSQIIGFCLRKLEYVVDPNVLNVNASNANASNANAQSAQDGQDDCNGDGSVPIARDTYMEAVSHVEGLLQNSLDNLSDVLSDVERILRRANSVDAHGDYAAPLLDEVERTSAIIKENGLEPWFYRELKNPLWIEALNGDTPSLV